MPDRIEVILVMLNKLLSVLIPKAQFSELFKREFSKKGSCNANELEFLMDLIN